MLCVFGVCRLLPDEVLSVVCLFLFVVCGVCCLAFCCLAFVLR